MSSFRERRSWLVGIISIAVIAAAVGLAFSINRFEGLRGVYTLSADLRDAAGLIPGNEVRVAGLKVGTVKEVRLTERAARVEMEIADDVRVPSESTLEVKLKTLLGQKFIELVFPKAFLAAASAGEDPEDTTKAFLADGDVIPRSQTSVPFEIHQAATEGTAVLGEIDKKALRRMIVVLSDTLRVSRDELRTAVTSASRATDVLDDKGGEITTFLRSAEDATKTLADGSDELQGILSRSAEVLGTLAERRETVSSLLAATNDLSRDLTILIRVASGSISTATADLDTLLLAVEGELGTIDRAMEDLGLAQEMFGQPLSFGRFTEGHVCAVISADTCFPPGSPIDPGLPRHGIQPEPHTGRVLP